MYMYVLHLTLGKYKLKFHEVLLNNFLPPFSFCIDICLPPQLKSLCLFSFVCLFSKEKKSRKVFLSYSQLIQLCVFFGWRILLQIFKAAGEFQMDLKEGISSLISFRRPNELKIQSLVLLCKGFSMWKEAGPGRQGQELLL